MSAINAREKKRVRFTLELEWSYILSRSQRSRVQIVRSSSKNNISLMSDCGTFRNSKFWQSCHSVKTIITNVQSTAAVRHKVYHFNTSTECSSASTSWQTSQWNAWKSSSVLMCPFFPEASCRKKNQLLLVGLIANWVLPIDFYYNMHCYHRLQMLKWLPPVSWILLVNSNFARMIVSQLTEWDHHFGLTSFFALLFWYWSNLHYNC